MVHDHAVELQQRLGVEGHLADHELVRGHTEGPPVALAAVAAALLGAQDLHSDVLGRADRDARVDLRTRVRAAYGKAC